jgi:hypothetical protein
MCAREEIVWKVWAVVIAWLASSARSQDAPTAPIPAPPPGVTLAETRAIFARVDANHDGKLDTAEMQNAKLDLEIAALGDQNADHALTMDEFVGGYPLVLARHGQHAAPDLESEALRIRASTPARKPSDARDASGVAMARLAGTRRVADRDLAPAAGSAQRAPGSPASEGPAGLRLRNASGGAEAEAKVRAAREALDQRLRTAHRDGANRQDGANDGSPAASQPRSVPPPASDALSELRRRASERAAANDTVTAQRLRAARDSLDSRIRAARADEGSGDDERKPASNASNGPSGPRGVVQSPADVPPRADLRQRASGESAPPRPLTPRDALRGAESRKDDSPRARPDAPPPAAPVERARGSDRRGADAPTRAREGAQNEPKPPPSQGL